MGYALRVFFVQAGEKGIKLPEIQTYYAEEFGDNIQHHPSALLAAVGAEGDSDFESYDLRRLS